jgi:hypothetical protein
MPAERFRLHHKPNPPKGVGVWGVRLGAFSARHGPMKSALAVAASLHRIER